MKRVRRYALAVLVFAFSVALGFSALRRKAPIETGVSAPSHGEGAKAVSDPSLEIRVVFGYKDARPARFVADRYERMLVVDRLLAACDGDAVVCGFRRDPRDMDLFTKTIRGSDGRPREVRVVLAASSAGPDDETNRADPYQRRRSASARERFLGGLREADVVLYNGHSRAGGGPDFRPPRIRGDHVDYAWYRAHEPGLRETISALRTDRGREPGRLRLLGFLSCASTSLFVGRVERVRPGLATLSSPKLLYFADAHEATLGALRSVLESETGARPMPKLLVGAAPRRGEDGPPDP